MSSRVQPKYDNVSIVLTSYQFHFISATAIRLSCDTSSVVPHVRLDGPLEIWQAWPGAGDVSDVHMRSAGPSHSLLLQQRR